jgi:hypothetical protein
LEGRDRKCNDIFDLTLDQLKMQLKNQTKVGSQITPGMLKGSAIAQFSAPMKRPKAHSSCGSGHTLHGASPLCNLKQ